MKKNKMIALGIATICFFLFFEGIFNPKIDNPVWTVISLVGLLGGIMASIFIGNNEQQEEHH